MKIRCDLGVGWDRLFIISVHFGLGLDSLITQKRFVEGNNTHCVG
jgi:hypothetical protein